VIFVIVFLFSGFNRRESHAVRNLCSSTSPNKVGLRGIEVASPRSACDLNGLDDVAPARKVPGSSARLAAEGSSQ
jgi:hypothetical protein